MKTPALLYVSFHYPFGGSSGSHRTARLARHMQALDWDVTVLCGPAPSNGSAPQDVPFRLVSAESPLNRRPEARPPGPVAPSPPTPNQPSRLRRFLREAAFIPDPQIYWIPSALAAARRSLAEKPADAILCSGPPFSTFILGGMLKRMWRAILALDYRDVWLDHPWWPVPRWRRGPEAWMERRLLAAADLVVANHHPMLEGILARLPRMAGRSLVIPNGFDPDELGPPVRPAWRRGERFEIVYSGTLYRRVPGREAGGEPISVDRPSGFFRALREISERGGFGPGGARVTFVGAKPWTDEASSLMECARACGVDDMVQVLPRLEKIDVVPILRQAHLLLNILYYTEAQVAQKVYDYLHLEIPILSLLRESEVNASLVRGARAGPIVDPADQRGIVEAIEAVLGDYEAGRPAITGDRAFIDRFDARRQAGALNERLRALMRARGEAPEALR